MRPFRLHLPITLTFFTFCLSICLSIGQTSALVEQELAAARESYRPIAEKQWADKKLIHAGTGLEMPFEYRIFGEKAVGGRSLYISLHGGGNTHPSMNDQQWQNQIGLYSPNEGVYIAPRAPTNTWNLWHEDHMDDLIDELIKTATVMEDVDPDKVYLMGYSAGGDGVYQLAPRMADRWAAASMMAGHPGDAAIINLRNLPFAIFMGGKDAAYNRNGLAAEWETKLDSLQQSDPGSYPHLVKIYPELGHWMERRDTVAVDWMAGYRRDTAPEKVIWVQDDRTHDRFYWLGLPPGEASVGKTLVVSVDGQRINIEHNDYDRFYIYLTSRLLNLDKRIRIYHQGKRIFSGKVRRSPAVIRETARRLDAGKVAEGKLLFQNEKITVM